MCLIHLKFPLFNLLIKFLILQFLIVLLIVNHPTIKNTIAKEVFYIKDDKNDCENNTYHNHKAI